MSARVYISTRGANFKIKVQPEPVELEAICPACLEVKDLDFRHTCSLCLDCCDCRTCRACGDIMLLTGCTACGQCRACCTCWACRNCNAPHTHKTQLCALCGRGLQSSCGCCPHQRGRDIIGVERFSNPVNLERYAAVEPEHNQRNPSRRLIAAEMEICGVRTDQRSVAEVLRTWNASIVGDGSLPSGGFEINTHPASGDFFLEQIEDICGVLQRAKAWVTSEAGCHTHIDARDLGYVGMSRLLRLAACTELALFSMIPSYRRNGTYCTFWAPQYLRHIHSADEDLSGNTNTRREIIRYRQAIMIPLYGDTKKEKISSARRSKGNGPRYRGTNVHSWTYRGTIEFRMPTGTIYPDNVINWGLMLANLVDLAAFRSNDEIRTMTKEVEAMFRKDTLYNTSFSSIPPRVHKASVALLKDLAPSDPIRDWITERIAWAKKITINTTFKEEYN